MSDKSYLVRTGAILIACCIAALLAGILLYGYICNPHKQEELTVQFIIQTDSTGRVMPSTQHQADSLMAVMERHEHLLHDKYEHILEQKEIFNDVLTLGGMLLAVVLSLFGFFGYKSLNAIEENVKEQAKITANNAAQSSFKGKFDEYKREAKNELEEHIKAQVKEQTGKQYAEGRSALNQSVNDKVKNAVKKYGEQIDEQKAAIGNVSQSMNNLDEKYSKLNDRLLKIEDGLTAMPKPRRTLANAGRIGFVGVKEDKNKTDQDMK